MLNVNQLSRLHRMAIHSTVPDEAADNTALEVLRAIIAAKSQPITAGALNAAGWWKSTPLRMEPPNETRGTALYYCCAILDEDLSFDVILDADGQRMPNVRNVYDLTELVRLLGAAEGGEA